MDLSQDGLCNDLRESIMLLYYKKSDLCLYENRNKSISTPCGKHQLLSVNVAGTHSYQTALNLQRRSADRFI